MKFRCAGLFLLLIFLVSCVDEGKRASEQAKAEKKKEQVFASISQHWKFNADPMNPTSQSLVASSSAWRDLLHELSQKPQSSIEAFQKKAKVLSEKIKILPKQLPPEYDKPEIRARIAVLTTKINALDLFINLNDIPPTKVNNLISDINMELASLQAQLDEIVRKLKIPKEQGEEDMIRMLDTTRAVPTKTQKLPN
jgi:hypothetical protein